MAEPRTFRFRSRPEAVAAARRALDGFDSQLDAAAFYDASLCVSELVTNAVLHSTIGPDDELQLDVAIEGGHLRVSVTDSGTGFSPPEPVVGDDSGWGLFIVDRLSTRWGVDRTGGTRVWFEIGVGARATEGVPAAAARRDGDDADDPLESHVRRRSAGFRLRPQTTA